MSEDLAVALQLRPFTSALEAGLAQRFEVVRWFELGTSERQQWLSGRAASVRAVVSSGDLGCSNDLMAALPSLGIIAINGVGLDKVDLSLARSRGVRVVNTPGLLADDVADLAVGLIIALLREIPAADAFVRRGGWEQGGWPLARKVTGRRFGILGLGAIGSAIARRLAAFGPVSYSGPRRKPVPELFHAQLLDLAQASDVLIVACSANETSLGIVNAAVIDALGPQGYLVNISRGSIVEEGALAAALAAGRLRGAALDVFENEPHVPDGLRTSGAVVLTPHIASATEETRARMADLILQNLDAFLSGAPPPTAVV
jgi:lactate dehydrogenase-like 2-hydroxyacid dehydrogenase